ncbi:FixH family protein [Pseudomonas sp. UL073]|uniref:FixH family protein n=1 Tax=Zestomonas insulae TaxID=2809017 RepID=A0ABS2I8X4_9GAMM|nr:FixH family protein [Pseudomonas insulae]MBM7059440.1 FixH family protein [Pseudomonas insulae]
MPAQPQHTTRWYKNVWPWIIIGMLATSVILSINLIRVAVQNQDSLVTDNYYEAGKGIARSLDRERLARDLKIHAKIHVDELTGELSLLLAGDSQPATVQLSLISPTQPDKDLHIQMTRSTGEAGRYVGQLPQALDGRRFVELLGEQDGQTWRLFEEENVSPGSRLELGDEAIPGAEEQAR